MQTVVCLRLCTKAVKSNEEWVEMGTRRERGNGGGSGLQCDRTVRQTGD